MSRFDGIGRKPSGEKPRDIEDTPSLTGVLAHFRLHLFNAIRQAPTAVLNRVLPSDLLKGFYRLDIVPDDTAVELV